MLQLDVDSDNNTLTFGVEQQEEREDKGEESGVKYHRVERSSHFQRRAMRLPENADLSNVAAKYENGVLRMSVPKMEKPRETAKRIQVA